MSLVDIKQYMMQVRIANFSNICMYFNKDPEQIRGMLKIWINKGRLRCFRKTDACGSGCTKCRPEFTEIYEWVSSGSSV